MARAMGLDSRTVGGAAASLRGVGTGPLGQTPARVRLDSGPLELTIPQRPNLSASFHKSAHVSAMDLYPPQAGKPRPRPHTTVRQLADGHPSVGGDTDTVRFPSLEGIGVGIVSLAYL